MVDKLNLVDTLQRLHALLAQVQGTPNVVLDEPTVRLLRTIQADIGLLVGSDRQATAEARSVANSLREALVDFEVEHPQITSLLGRLGDALANLGI